MNTIVVLLALAAVAIAAPSSSNLGEKLQSSQQQWTKTTTREKKSPTLKHHHDIQPIDSYHHGGIIPPQIVEHHHLGLKPVYGHGLGHGHGHIIEHGHGYGHEYGHGHIFREDEAAVNTEEGKCAKEVKEKCGQREAVETTDLLRSSSLVSEKVKMDHLEVPSRNMEEKLQDNILLARVAIDNMQHNLGELEKSASARAQWKHDESQSDINLHSNIETAKRALEQVHKNFEDLHSKNQHASPKQVELADTEHFEKMSEEERMSQWKDAIDNIQKNVEIANNIKESFTPTSNDKQTNDPASRHAIIMKQAENIVDKNNKDKEKEMDMSASNIDVTMIKPMESLHHESMVRHNNDNEGLVKLNEEDHKTLEGTNKLHSLKSAVEDMEERNKEDVRLELLKMKEDRQKNATMALKDTVTEVHETKAKQVKSEILDELNDGSNLARANINIKKTIKEHEHITALKSSHDMDDMFEASSITQENKMKLNKVEEKHTMIQPKLSDDTLLRRETNIDSAVLEGKNAEMNKMSNEKKIEHQTDSHMNMPTTSSKQMENKMHAKSADSDIPFMKAADNGFSPSQISKQEIENHITNLQKGEEKFRKFLDNHQEKVKSGNHEEDFNEMSMRNSGKHFHHEDKFNHEHSLNTNEPMIHGHQKHSELRDMSGKSAMVMSGGWRNFNQHESSRSAYGPSVAASSADYSSGAGSGAGGASSGAASSGGAIGVFPNANVGGCAVPLLLSCSPSVVSGSLAKAYPAASSVHGYGASSGSAGGYGASDSASSASSYGASSHSSYGTAPAPAPAPAPIASAPSPYGAAPSASPWGASSHAVAAASAGSYGIPALSPYRAREDFTIHNKRDVKNVNGPLKEKRTLKKRKYLNKL